MPVLLFETCFDLIECDKVSTLYKIEVTQLSENSGCVGVPRTPTHQPLSNA
jgi:hypothetical protein